MNTAELLNLIRAARLRIFGCPTHGKHALRGSQCVDCILERVTGVPIPPVSQIVNAIVRPLNYWG